MWEDEVGTRNAPPIACTNVLYVCMCCLVTVLSIDTKSVYLSGK